MWHPAWCRSALCTTAVYLVPFATISHQNGWRLYGSLGLLVPSRLPAQLEQVREQERHKNEQTNILQQRLQTQQQQGGAPADSAVDSAKEAMPDGKKVEEAASGGEAAS